MEDPHPIALTLRKAIAQDSEFTYLAKSAAFRHYVELALGRWDEDEQRRLYEQRFREFDADILLQVFRQRLDQFQAQRALGIGFDELQSRFGRLGILSDCVGRRLGRLCLNANWQ
jgi:hypothetical protein